MRPARLLTALIRRSEGSQPVEYALIVALVSIVLSIALSNTATGIGSTFAEIGARVASCFAALAVTC